MSDVNLDFTVSNNNIDFNVAPNDITITPTDFQLSFYSAASPGAAGNSGQLQYNNGGILGGVQGANYDAGILTFLINSTKITGGSNHYYLQTDGTGNLTWSIGTGNMQGNGTVSGANTQIQFNDNGMNFGGNAGFTFERPSGNVNIPGNLIVVGNIIGNFSNIANANYANYAGNAFSVDGGNVNGQVSNALIAGTVYNNAQPNITSLGDLTDLRVINSSIHLGNSAGVIGQNANSVAIGTNAGRTNQSVNGVAIGTNAGYNNQGSESVAIGSGSGNNSGAYSVAIGVSSGGNAQGGSSIAIGLQAGGNAQGSSSIAIGQEAGRFSQGNNAIAIGGVAGQTNQPNNTIILNATGSALNVSTANATYIKPVRNIATTNYMFYEPTTGEVSYYTGSQSSTIVYSIENVSIIGAQSGTYTFNVIDGAQKYSTANAIANLTLNFRGNSTVSLNSLLSNGQSTTTTYVMTTGATAYGVTGVNIDGTGQTIKWVGNITPIQYSNTTTAYTFTLIKTGTSTYTVLGSGTRYG
jgi:hypothetical protein